LSKREKKKGERNELFRSSPTNKGGEKRNWPKKGRGGKPGFTPFLGEGKEKRQKPGKREKKRFNEKRGSREKKRGGKEKGGFLLSPPSWIRKGGGGKK